MSKLFQNLEAMGGASVHQGSAIKGEIEWLRHAVQQEKSEKAWLASRYEEQNVDKASLQAENARLLAEVNQLKLTLAEKQINKENGATASTLSKRRPSPLSINTNKNPSASAMALVSVTSTPQNSMEVQALQHPQAVPDDGSGIDWLRPVAALDDSTSAPKEPMSPLLHRRISAKDRGSRILPLLPNVDELTSHATAPQELKNPGNLGIKTEKVFSMADEPCSPKRAISGTRREKRDSRKFVSAPGAVSESNPSVALNGANTVVTSETSTDSDVKECLRAESVVES